MGMTAREIFEAPPGCAIISVDYDACEMRTWAQVNCWLFGIQNCDLPTILNNPSRCPHVEFGARLKNLEDKEFDDWARRFARAYALKKSDPAEFKKMRALAKGPNFGLPGGMRAEKLRDYCRLGYGVDLSIELAQAAVDTWESMYREAKPYLQWVKDLIGGKPGARSQVEFFVSKMVRGDVGYTDGCNGFFQNLAAYVAKVAVWRVTREMYSESRKSPLFGSRPGAFVHDEMLIFAPKERIHEAGHRMAKIFCDTAMEICPDILFTAAPAAMYSWSKKAGDPLYARDGKLCGPKDGGELIVFEDRVKYAP